MSKSSKLYKDSPSIKKDEEGKPGISKPTTADSEDMGLSGNPLPNDDGEMPIQLMHDRQQTEMKDTHKRHQTEIKDMHQRHSKEHSKIMEMADTGGSEESNIEGTK